MYDYVTYAGEQMVCASTSDTKSVQLLSLDRLTGIFISLQQLCYYMKDPNDYIYRMSQQKNAARGQSEIRENQKCRHTSKQKRNNLNNHLEMVLCLRHTETFYSSMSSS